MKPTDLEKSLLAAFFADNQIDAKEFIKSRDAIQVSDRRVCRGGCMTEFRRHECLRVGNNSQSYKYWDITGTLNPEKIVVGFLFYIESGYITAIEGFGFDKAWPEKIVCYDLIYGRA